MDCPEGILRFFRMITATTTAPADDADIHSVPEKYWGYDTSPLARRHNTERAIWQGMTLIGLAAHRGGKSLTFRSPFACTRRPHSGDNAA